MTLKHILLPSTEHPPGYNGQQRLLPWGTDLDGSAEQLSLQEEVSGLGVKAEAQQHCGGNLSSLLLTNPELLHCKNQFSPMMAVSF